MKIKVSPEKLAALLTEVYQQGETSGYGIAQRQREDGKDRLMRAIRETEAASPIEADPGEPPAPAYASDSDSWGLFDILPADLGEVGTEIGWPYSGPVITRHMLRQDAEMLREKLADAEGRLAQATKNQEMLALAIGDRDGLIADLRTVEKEQAGTIAKLLEDGNLSQVQAAKHKAAQLQEDVD